MIEVAFSEFIALGDITDWINEVLKWSLENNITVVVMQTISIPSTAGGLRLFPKAYFRNEEDATAFKLRWM